MLLDHAERVRVIRATWTVRVPIVMARGHVPTWTRPSST
jgi:hypothetical protein